MSVADELEKMANLRDNGVLNEDEFRCQKAKILGKHVSPPVGKIGVNDRAFKEADRKIVTSEAFISELKRSDTLGYTMLAIIVITALLIWQSGSLGLPAIAFSFVAVIATAILAGIEAKQLGIGSDADKTPLCSRRVSPGVWSASILLLWVVGFPAYFYARSRYGVRNLFLPAIALSFAFLVAPIIAAPELPEVDAPEVVDLAQQAINESPLIKLSGEIIGPITISNPGEVSFDKSQQKRVARAELKTKFGSEVIYYSVEWQNRSKGMIWVQIQDHP